jgi:phosphoenolpyruvate---glycerone phosphotransferase subunit DhaL
MQPSSLPDVELVVRTMAETIVANEAYFSQLDAVVADGDFGYSLARGFSEVLAGFDQFDRSSPSTFLKKVALVISSKVGGASGPLWGTAFLRAAAACDKKQELAPEDVIAMLRAAAGGIQQRGGAVLGDKTLLDALIPATDVLQSSLQSADSAVVAIQRAAEEARRAAEATSAMIAKKGRAAYTGERSIGSVDAGAVAIAVIAEAVSAAWREHHIAAKEPA